ncbi:lactonase family protein [Lactobacillus sp. DCY120]|uniref:Lactonase family protein n=1 Tax=Bombilactobacillus apium TaxID=2675299 RepID=A0A850R146_9LACO|nr:lactonase family protein [Bombilactobacillus apium]NVY96809.1 lactonase family protein [Bombilactobacillus apium]
MHEQLLIGGYTKQSSQGIYQLDFDSQTGQLSSVKLVVNTQGSTYFALSNANILYTIMQEDQRGGIAAYDVNQDFKYLGTSYQPQTSPAYVEISEAKQLLFTANFHTGQVIIHRINPDKTLTIADTIQLTGSSLRPEQDSSHPHCAHLSPDGKLIICDYGTDLISTYNLTDTGQVELQTTFSVTAGSAPRHLIFNSQHPEIAYCICELSSTVLVLGYQDGNFELLNSYSLLPESYQGDNTAAAIRLSSDGRFLYTSNRGHNSIISFEVQNAGKQLEHLQTIKTRGDFPRDFNFDLTENYLLVPHQKSNDVTIFNCNSQTGYLTFNNHDTQVPEGTCIVF